MKNLRKHYKAIIKITLCYFTSIPIVMGLGYFLVWLFFNVASYLTGVPIHIEFMQDFSIFVMIVMVLISQFLFIMFCPTIFKKMEAIND